MRARAENVHASEMHKSARKWSLEVLRSSYESHCYDHLSKLWSKTAGLRVCRLTHLGEVQPMAISLHQDEERPVWERERSALAGA